MHFMVLLSCHNIHIVVLVVTMNSNKEAHIVAHCETNIMEENKRKENKTKVLKQLSSNLLDYLRVESVIINKYNTSRLKSFLL